MIVGAVGLDGCILCCEFGNLAELFACGFVGRLCFLQDIGLSLSWFDGSGGNCIKGFMHASHPSGFKDSLLALLSVCVGIALLSEWLLVKAILV